MRKFITAAIVANCFLLVNCGPDGDTVSPEPKHKVVSGVYGGGPIYNKGSTSIPELKSSGFTDVIVWNIWVLADGELNFNMEFPIATNGRYIGDSTHPDFASNMASLKQGNTSVKTLTFSIGSSDGDVFHNIQELIASEGTGPSSTLYKNFMALKSAIPAIDAIDYDDESNYDHNSMVEFSLMLGKLGYKVTLCPYTDSSFWQKVAADTNKKVPGTIVAAHLQAYSGGAGNNPCAGWDMNGVPVYPGMSSGRNTPSQVHKQMAKWKAQCGITGGWMWLYDDFQGTASVYANAINTALQ